MRDREEKKVEEEVEKREERESGIFEKMFSITYFAIDRGRASRRRC